MPIHSRLLAKFRGSDLTSSLRGGSRAELVVTVLLLIAAVGGVVAPLALGIDGPKAAAEAYLAAESRADATAVNSLIDVHTDPVGSADATLLDQRALRAAVTHQGAFPPPIDISQAAVSGNLATVTAAFGTGTGTRQTKLTLERSFPPFRIQGVWKVRVDPSFLHVQVPAAAGDLTVDGIPVRIPKNRPAKVAVFPGDHLISTTGGPLFAAQSQKVTASTSYFFQPVSVPLTITPEGTASANRVVAAAFASCASQVGQEVSGCPQVEADFGAPSVRWSLLGDPTSNMTLKIDPVTAFVQVLGHFRMIATVVTSSGRVTHRPSSGGYSMPLRPSDGAFSPGPITGENALLASRPPDASDQVILDAVRAGLVKCGQATVADPPDCPQVIFADASNVSWSIQSDPMGDSAVAFQPQADSFVVAGRVTMHYRYDSSLLGIALHNDNSAEYPFTAHLFWDGQHPILVTIFGSTVR